MIDLKEKIVAFAVELRTTQKRRLRTPEGPAQDVIKEMEFMARKKLNDLVDLYLFTQEKEAGQVEPLKER